MALFIVQPRLIGREILILSPSRRVVKCAFYELYRCFDVPLAATEALIYTGLYEPVRCNLLFNDYKRHIREYYKQMGT